MPLHDWTRVHAGEYHHFHNTWIADLSRALNKGLLPKGFYALGEQQADEETEEDETDATYKPDVLALQRWDRAFADAGVSEDVADARGGLAVAEAPPQVAQHDRVDLNAFYAGLRRTVAIRHVSRDHPVALIEIASPGNKDRRDSVSRFVDKCVAALMHGVHVVVIDPFPPRSHDPDGLPLCVARAAGTGWHLRVPEDGSLLAVGFEASDELNAYTQVFSIGRPLEPLPLFYKRGWYVPLPLEQTYTAAFDALPEHLVEQLEAAGT